MIIIWSNGKDGCDHSTYFIEYDDSEIGSVHAVLLLRMRDPDGFALGYAGNITWIDRASSLPLFDYVSASLAEAETPLVPRALILKVADHEEARLRKLLEHAKAAKPDDVRWHNNIDRNIAAMVALRFNLKG